MKGKIATFAALVLLLGVPGVFTPQPAAAQDNPVPFVTTVTVNPVSNFNYTTVAIPAGMRLVIDYVSISGAAQTAHGAIQPIVILNTTVAGNGGQNLFYFAPQNTSFWLPTQFYMTQKTTIFADTLLVGPAFAGFSPTFDILSVVISGHLVPIPSVLPTYAPAPTPAVTRETLEEMGIKSPPLP